MAGVFRDAVPAPAPTARDEASSTGFVLAKSATNTSTTNQQQHHQQQHHRRSDSAATDPGPLRPPSSSKGEAGIEAGPGAAAVSAPSLLHPRMAVVLGVSRRWHPFLFASRLLSVVPAIRWGLPCALRLLVQIHLLVLGEYPSGRGVGGHGAGGALGGGEEGRGSGFLSFETRLKLTETALAIIWVWASPLLSGGRANTGGPPRV